MLVPGIEDLEKVLHQPKEIESYTTVHGKISNSDTYDRLSIPACEVENGREACRRVV